MITCPKCGVNYDGAERFCPKDGTRLEVTGEHVALRSYTPRTSIPPDRDPLLNKIIQGRYRVNAQIGEGGMGVVYVAEHVQIEKKVALKVLRDDFSKRPEVVARFRQEARSASKIGSEHIVDVTDFGELDDGGVYFVMEYLQGKGLSEVIRSEVLSVERIVHIVRQIAVALSAAHKLGIVHRDLKPENIYLIDNDEKTDFVKILDFGIAKISDRDSEGQRLTKTGMIFGTPEYMSPEQAAGKPLDHRVDIYALGCIMFEMFTGKVPFDGETFMAVLTQHMFEPIPEIEAVAPEVEVPENLKAIIYKAMAKEKEDRYESMLDLAQDLELSLSDRGYISVYRDRTPKGALINLPLQGATRGMTSAEVTGTKAGRKKGKGGLAALVVILLLLGGTGVAYFAGMLPIPPVDDPKSELVVASPSTALQAPEEEKGKREKDSPSEDTSPEEKGEEQIEEIPKIEVSVMSEPEGAVILVKGMGQVCSSAPCKIQLEEGAPIEVEARLDGVSKKLTFTASEQNKELTIEVSRPGKIQPRRKSVGSKTTKEHTKSKSKKNDGLKIPDFFKNN